MGCFDNRVAVKPRRAVALLVAENEDYIGLGHRVPLRHVKIGKLDEIIQ